MSSQLKLTSETEDVRSSRQGLRTDTNSLSRNYSVNVYFDYNQILYFRENFHETAVTSSRPRDQFQKSGRGALNFASSDHLLVERDVSSRENAHVSLNSRVTSFAIHR